MTEEEPIVAPATPDGPLEMSLDLFNGLRENGTLDAYLAGLGRTFRGASVNPNTGIVTL